MGEEERRICARPRLWGGVLGVKRVLIVHFLFENRKRWCGNGGANKGRSQPVVMITTKYGDGLLVGRL